jgi:hypothetical protein
MKMFGLLPKRAELSNAEYHDYHRHPHGSIACRPSTLRGYVQSHQVDTDLLGPEQRTFDSVVEAWFDNKDDFLNVRNEPFVARYISQDEPRFINMDGLEFLAAEQEVLRSGPMPEDLKLHEVEYFWSHANRPTSFKLLQFISPDGNPDWARNDDTQLGIRLGAFRHVRCHPIAAIHGDSASFRGVQELWWPHRTSFERSIAAAPDALEELLARAGRSVTTLVQAERFF